MYIHSPSPSFSFLLALAVLFSAQTTTWCGFKRTDALSLGFRENAFYIHICSTLSLSLSLSSTSIYGTFDTDNHAGIHTDIHADIYTDIYMDKFPGLGPLKSILH